MSEKVRKIIILCLFFGLVALPIIIQGNLYFVSGDDMRLYYIFPEKYLKNFTFNIISDNTLGGANTGYYPTSQMAPMLYVILLLKKIVPFINTQYLMYGLNYASGFLFFYFFVSIWLKTENIFSFFAKILAGLFYIFSPLLVGTLYRNQLMSIYLLALMPASLFFFSKAVLNKKYIYSIVVALILSVFSTTLNTCPWSIPILIAGIPFFIVLFWFRKRSFVVNTLVLSFVLLVLNMHWIFHFVNSNINNTGIAGSLSYFSTDEFKKENIRGILGVSTLLSPLEPVLVMVDYNFRQNFTLISLKNIIFIMIIVFAGIFINRVTNRKILKFYFVGLIGFLLSWFLFSPNLGNWGPGLFLKFATTLPFATMFRNMWDKFALPFAFYYSALLVCSLFILDKIVKNKKMLNLLLIFVFVVLISDTGSFFKPRTQIEGNTATVSGEFNDDFSNLTNYLQKLENQSRVLWIPMTAPNYVSVEDKFNIGHYYSGLSPLRVLIGRGDYAGRFAFMLPSDVFYGDKLIEMLKQEKYAEFAINMQRMNVGYIVLDKQDLPASMKPYLFDADMKYLKFQNDALKNELLGQKIKDFGDRYSLYEINTKYLSDRLYLTGSYDVYPKDYSGLQYNKVDSYLYKIQIPDLKDVKKLVFLDPYYKDWVLYLNKSGNSIPFEKGKNTIVQGWANGWEIDPAEIKKGYSELLYEYNADGGINLSFDLYFEPQKYNQLLYPFTIVAYAMVGLYLALYFAVNFKKKYYKHDQKHS